jgi:hypothetical protein
MFKPRDFLILCQLLYKDYKISLHDGRVFLPSLALLRRRLLIRPSYRLTHDIYELE